MVNVDGPGLQQLTPFDLDAANPDWSPDGVGARAQQLLRLAQGQVIAPDGTKIVYDRFHYRGQGHGWRLDLYTMNPNGTDRERADRRSARRLFGRPIGDGP